MTFNDDVSTSPTIAAMRALGKSAEPAISVTTSVEPSGVLVTPTLAAIITPRTNGQSVTPGRWGASASPTQNPTKKSGMMNPPPSGGDTDRGTDQFGCRCDEQRSGRRAAEQSVDLELAVGEDVRAVEGEGPERDPAEGRPERGGHAGGNP